MRACTHCGLSIGDTAAFCTVCGTPAGSGHPGPVVKPLPAQPALCALCGHPGPLADVESLRLCQRCRGELELLTEREPRAGMSIRPITTEEDERRSTARTVDAVYSALLDGATCRACEAMDGKTTTDLNEAEGWTPNPKCTDPEGCRCLVAFQMTSLAASEVQAFLEYAAQSGRRANAQCVDQFRQASVAAEEEQARLLYEALEPMHKAYPCEKTDPGKAAALYRESIVRLLDVTEDPLNREDVRRNLLFIFNRLSLVLKKDGLHAEALEEIDSADSLGLLDCQDSGIKGHREALKKRRGSLRRSITKAAHDST
jgi:zinc-ribbon domain